MINAALTNTPALDDMEALIAAASQQLTGENTVDDDELLQQLRWMLTLPLSSTADDTRPSCKS
ncbi:phage protease [Serratia symbiotica]|uniref:phage protease n=1 Tax=Serratia symbiotica TaxID=138074 RepID=UPI0020903FBF|nr:phage protease [Serratia symbiotica]